MGCCSSENRPAQHVHQRQEPAQQARAQPASRNLMQDVNEQYQLYFDILPDKTSGSGLKKTLAYISHVDMAKIETLRNTFWETRVDGSQEIWAALRMIISENDGIVIQNLETCESLMQAAELKAIQNSLQHVWHVSGAKYDIPIFCINDPIEIQLQQDKGLKETSENMPVTLSIRCVAFNGKDLEVNSNLAQKVSELKEEINMQAQLKYQIQSQSIKLFYCGKELMDSYTVGRYNVGNKSIVIAHLKLY